MTWMLYYGDGTKRPLTKEEAKPFAKAKLKADGTLDRRTNKALLKIEQALTAKAEKA